MNRTLRRLMSRTSRLRRPPVMAAIIGLSSTLVLALVVVIVLLLSGGGKAVPDNAALIAAIVALGGVFTTQLVNITLEAQRAQDSALQAFLDQISHSDIHTDTYSKLRTAPASGHERAILRSKLQTLLLQLDEERKGVLLSFLHGAKLSRKKEIIPSEYKKGRGRWKYPILRLNDIDFSRTKRTPDTKLTFDDLRGIILRGAKVSKVNLSGANLSDADLSNADLSEAQLRTATPEDSENIPGESENEYEKAKADNATAELLKKTDLSRANLRGADLSGAKGITSEELEHQTKSLEDATMPNGLSYEDWLKSKGREKDGENSSPS